jgi:hypothetical protein
MLKAETLKGEEGLQTTDYRTTGQRAEDGGASNEHRTSNIQPRTLNVGERGKAEGPAREHREVMEALREIRDGLEAVRRSAGQEEPINRSEAQRIFAVLQRLRSKRAGMMAPLYDVFVATVLEGRSQRAAAKSCDCSPALLSKRVGELEEEFELPLQQLQNYAKPLLEMETSVKGQRYAINGSPIAWFADLLLGVDDRGQMALGIASCRASCGWNIQS